MHLQIYSLKKFADNEWIMISFREMQHSAFGEADSEPRLEMKVESWARILV